MRWFLVILRKQHVQVGGVKRTERNEGRKIAATWGKEQRFTTAVRSKERDKTKRALGHGKNKTKKGREFEVPYACRGQGGRRNKGGGRVNNMVYGRSDGTRPRLIWNKEWVGKRKRGGGWIRSVRGRDFATRKKRLTGQKKKEKDEC